MQINYYMAQGERPCFYQLHLANRHLQAAFASSSEINELSLKHVLSPNNKKESPSFLERATHLTFAALECSPLGLLVALIDNFFFNIDPEKPSLLPFEFAAPKAPSRLPIGQACSIEPIDSSKLNSYYPPIHSRSEFMKQEGISFITPPPTIGKSTLVPDWMTEGLMRKKKE